MKFAHIADTHIKNLKYHYEYKKVFEQLYEKLRSEDVDYIIHCGDIAHTKTQLSPEFFDLCSNFLASLASIAPTYVILGNHDGNLKNSSRQDAITPVVEALDNSNLFLLKDSGEEVLDESFTLNVLSVFDRDNWISPTDNTKINIALYHGAICNSRTDLGWIMEHGEDDLSIFQGHDFSFLGDIHKTNQILDHDGRIRYAGSTIQQNHGESNDKGFLIWDIEDRDNFTCEHHVLKNPKPFITIELTPKGRMPNKIKIPKGARVRLVSNNNLPLNTMKKAVEVAKHRFKPESITFLNRAAGERGNIDEYADGLEKDNLRDVAVQEELIREYVKDFQPDEELIKRVLRLNSKYNTTVEESEEIGRNINWKLEKLEWDNLFNFGEENVIDFKKVSGIVGIFGKNFSGKSSIIDSILFTLFNSTSKNERKNLNIINQNKEFGIGKVGISVGNKQYTVERKAEKYTKKLKGEQTMEAKTELNFECYDSVMERTESLNGTTRGETDKIIRKHFGTMEDFLMTSMSSQLGALQFIGEGSTRRKEILAKFLDLEMFDKKFKLAKEDATDLRGALKRLEGREFNDDIFNVEKEIIFNEAATREHSETCEATKKELLSIQADIDGIQKSIDSIPADLIDIKAVSLMLREAEKKHLDITNAVVSHKSDLLEKENLVKKIDNFISSFNTDELYEKQSIVAEKLMALRGLSDEISFLQKEKETKEERINLLKEVPCGSQFPNCKFICDAHTASKEIPGLISKVDSLDKQTTKINTEVESLDPEKIEDYLKKYKEVLDKKEASELETSKIKVEIERGEVNLKSIDSDIVSLEEQKQLYYDNKEIIENKGSFVKQLKKEKKAHTEKEKQLQECQSALMGFYKEHGSLEQKLSSLKEQKEELQNLREDYSAYDLFMRCVHTNGISYDIIKKKLPVINNEIAKVIANVVDFEVFFENDGKHMKIFIKHPRHEPRPIEMGSGAEKTIAAMAIRLALLSVSSLPKSDIFILDEPGTALDADNMDGFISILELIKSYFKTVILVSHLDSLKDCVDTQITIDKVDNYAKVIST
jgi:DNA repair exonuclease SbcCD ATPase subunit/DNA repair exonuclease SbcCD nuclease subunit